MRIVILGFAALLSAATVAGAGTIDFDGSMPGSLPAGFAVANRPGSSTELATGGPNGFQEVTSSLSHSPQNSLELRSDGWYSIVYHQLARQTTGELEVEFALRLDAEPHNAAAGLLLDDRTDGLMPAGNPGSYGVFFTGDWHGRQISWYDGASWKDMGSYALDTWYVITLLLDLDAGTFDISVDGVLKLDDVSANEPGLAGGVQRMVLYHDNGSGYSSSAWFDDISVRAVPLPRSAWMGLCLLLALGLGRRRWS